MYEMTGLYSEVQDDSSSDLPQDTESESLPSTITVNTASYEPISTISTLTTVTAAVTNQNSHLADTVIKCHSRQPSSDIVSREKPHSNAYEEDEFSKDCGILSFRPMKIQKYARIKVNSLRLRIQNKFKINKLIFYRSSCFSSPS